MRSNTLLAGSAIAALLLSPPSRANGRFPRAEQLVLDPNDPNEIVVAATYGLLVTSDRKNWYEVCENAFSFEPTFQGDAVIGIGQGGAWLASSLTSIAMSRDRGCDWQKVLEPGASTIADFAFAPSEPNRVVAVTTTELGTPVTELEDSRDGGAHWTKLGTPLPIKAALTVAIDPTNANHILATGLVDPSDETAPAVFLDSGDDGATWVTMPIPNTGLWAAPYIAAIHPLDPRRIFVRTDAWKNRSVIPTADDALLFSDDGGRTWTELLHPAASDPVSPGAKLLGFALAPDGSVALAGYGDPRKSSTLVEHSFAGVYESRTSDYSFGAPATPDAPLVGGSIGCLSWTATGIYLCFSGDGPEVIRFATEADFSAGSLTDLLRVSETKGPPPCCKGRAATTCDFAIECAPLHACADEGGTGQRENPASCGDDAGLDAAIARDGSDDASTHGDDESSPEPPSSSGCACTTRQKAAFASSKILALLACATGALRRSRHLKAQEGSRARRG